MRLALLSPLLLLAACRFSSPEGPAAQSPTPSADSPGVRAETYATGLVNPWALVFLPDGRLLVTERPGRLRIVDTAGALSEPVSGVPAVFAQGQGGLLDVALDPRFDSTQLVYLSFAEPGPNGTAGTAVARGMLVGTALQNVQVIYSQRPKMNGAGHFGSRLVFDRDGHLFITQGDRQQNRDSAQSLTAGLGKVVRVFPDGRVPPDNPFVSRAGALSEIWSYGHRNMQGATLDPATGRLWTIEHGARGGDELNHPEAGKNYGWPVITYGRDYNMTSIGEGAVKDGMEQPVYHWDPVIAPSGMTFYTGDALPGWRGSLLIGSLSPGALVRLEMTDGRVTRETRYLGALGERIRDVAQGPDGFVYVVTDNPSGRVLRVRPE